MLHLQYMKEATGTQQHMGMSLGFVVEKWMASYAPERPASWGARTGADDIKLDRAQARGKEGWA